MIAKDVLHEWYIKSEQVAPVRIRKLTRKSLVKKFKDFGFTKGAEVGVFKGRFSEYMCKVNPDLNLIGVDPYASDTDEKYHEEGDKRYNHAKERLEPYNCKLIRKTSMEAAKDVPYNSLDFVYIDGDHSFDFVMQDIIEWSKRVRLGGIVAGHDYYRFKRGGVVPAVDVYTEQHQIHEWFVTDEKAKTWFWVKDYPNQYYYK